MRKSISKKIRFEVFKRDGFTCQYCGGHPPIKVLEVDHIIAVASGGENDMDNLVTSCFDCNRGKSDRALDAVPQSLSVKAALVAEREAQIAGYSAIMMAKRDRIEGDVWCVVEHLYGIARTTNDRFNSIKMFVEKLGLHQVLEAADIAMAKIGSARHPAEAVYWQQQNQFKYFCGVCWGMIRDSEAGQ